MITESWLGESIPYPAITMSCNLNIHWQDRATPGGGFLVYVHKNIPTTRLYNLEQPNIEVTYMGLTRTI